MKEEMCFIVDESDTIIGTAPRSEVHAKKLFHRIVRILLFNSKGELFIHQRTFTKDVFPGYFDTCIAGTVSTGTYDEEARRELAEEVGITDAPLTNLFKFKNSETRVFCTLYKCVYDGPLTLQKEEIISGKFMALEDVKALLKKEKFNPNGVKVLELYEQRL